MVITASLDVVIIKDLGIPAETYRVSHAHFLLLLRSNKKVRWKSTPSGRLILVFIKLLVHHDFPGINWKVRVIERPVELLFCYRLVRRVMVWGEIFVCQGVGCLYSLLGIEYKHVLEEFNCCEVLAWNFHQIIEEAYQLDQRSGTCPSMVAAHAWEEIERISGSMTDQQLPQLALTAKSYVLTGNCVDNIIWWRSQKLGDDRELVDMVLSWEEWLALQHLREDTPGTPDINLNIVFLPCEHNLRGSVVSRRDIAGHLGVLDTGQTEVADLQIAILVDQDVAGLEIAMDNTCGVDILESPLFPD
jgi:hypothetical protein